MRRGIDEDDPARLAEGIDLILRDTELCSRLIDNGLERAHKDFNVAASRVAFKQLIGLDNGV
jgi:hypothetical protein